MYLSKLINTLLFICILSNLQAQELVNYEETWQEFLKKPKTSKISELTKPEKSSPIDYLKYCLMYATNYFCADDLSNTQKMLKEIDDLDVSLHQQIPGFVERDKDLRLKIDAYNLCRKHWIQFSTNYEVDQQTIEENALAKKVCEKGTLAKYSMMTSYNYYCMNDLTNAKKHFEDRLLRLVNTSFNPSRVPGLVNEINRTKVLWEGLELLDTEWSSFTETGKSNGYTFDFPKYTCNPIPEIKILLLQAANDFCGAGSEKFQLILDKQENTDLPIPSDVLQQIQWLSDTLQQQNEQEDQLKKIWSLLNAGKVITEDMEYPYSFPCDRELDIKAALLDGFKNICSNGSEALKRAQVLKDLHQPNLSQSTRSKWKELAGLIEKENSNVAYLGTFWKDFIPDNTLNRSIDFEFTYCDPINTSKAYVMDGIVHFCEKGIQRRQDIAQSIGAYEDDIPADLKEKIDFLDQRIAYEELKILQLDSSWHHYVISDSLPIDREDYPPKDTALPKLVTLYPTYCDKLAQAKSYLIKGHTNPCQDGETFLKDVMDLKKEYDLSFDAEINCSIEKLTSKIYQCKYWALVLEARRLTHAERELFGPKSSKIMKVDLNSAQQPCETDVVYEPIGYIGVKYVISTYLCQPINLAKMGDPTYYKKIASWVDDEVLTVYCEESMRCKEDFFVYLEGHTDGHRFNGRSYDRSLNIPEGTPYTHFHKVSLEQIDTLQKTTRNITSKLNNNMELGIARAWTVKQQLDFMGVPITIGAFEHPEEEKGGEFRKVDIELNITNLMLDFYEKTLNRLLDESGIGNRPNSCDFN